MRRSIFIPAEADDAIQIHISGYFKARTKKDALLELWKLQERIMAELDKECGLA